MRMFVAGLVTGIIATVAAIIAAVLASKQPRSEHAELTRWYAAGVPLKW
jgi:TRAP-type C4-dicarboxylate transport system permease large subunit